LKFEHLAFVKMTNCRHDEDVAKRPHDPAQLAKQVFDIAIGEAEDTVSESKRHPSPKRTGGIKGGKARAKSLTAAERADIARVAARARWKKS
jgi:hypothetical protein